MLFLSANAVPEGASFFASWCPSWIQAPKSSWWANSCALRSTIASNKLTPSEKFAACTTPMWFSSTILLRAGSSFSHPVVPMTTLTPRVASLVTFETIASGSENSIATSTSSKEDDSSPSPLRLLWISSRSTTWQSWSALITSMAFPIRP